MDRCTYDGILPETHSWRLSQIFPCRQKSVRETSTMSPLQIAGLGYSTPNMGSAGTEPDFLPCEYKPHSNNL